MSKINPQKGSLLATFSVALQLPEKLRKRIEERKESRICNTPSYLNGFFISDNLSGEAWGQKWEPETVKIEKYNTKFYIISYLYVKNIGSVKVPFFYN